MSSERATISPYLREKILSDPKIILEDQDLLGALVAANDEKNSDDNVVDLRGVAMERMGARLDQLEETHRNVIAAAYENMAGMNQIHRAVLCLLGPTEFDAFLSTLRAALPQLLGVDAAGLVLETGADASDPAIERLSERLILAETGFISAYVSEGRNAPMRKVTLRELHSGTEEIYGEMAAEIRSEACISLNFGQGRLPGLLVLGAKDAQLFTPNQGTDLLVFLGEVFERAMRRWLA
jgi:uncharacterized protein YigA (DUF484 family)